MTFLPEDALRLVLAVVVGGLVGFEREYRDKAAGFRTYILICTGAALFTLLSFRLGEGADVRIATGIVSGVGFLGAGAIMREGGKVAGITTAAGIWLTAALGMGLGGGQYTLVAAATALVLIVLWFFPLISHRIKDMTDEKTYVVTCEVSNKKLAELQALFPKHGLTVKNFQRAKKEDQMICTWEVTGRPVSHEALVKRLFDDPQVTEFHA
jgi:putative Mg2+ transporter-C (MgtC) family protein